MPSIASYDFGDFVETAVFLKDQAVFAVADGMGGHHGGERASAASVEQST